MNNKSNNVIVITFDEAYGAIGKIFLKSLTKNYPHHPEIVLLHKDLSTKTIQSLQQFPRLKCVDISNHPLIPGPSIKHLESINSSLFYARFLVWSKIFESYNKVLYMDVDAVVLAPLDDLFKSEEFVVFQESLIGSQQIFYDHNDPTLQKILANDHIEGLPSLSANAGVFCIPRKYRTPQHYQQFEDILSRYEPYLIWGDQSIINIWMILNQFKITKDFRYNFQVRLLTQKREMDAYKQMKYFHFNGMHFSKLILLVMQNAYLMFKIPIIGRWLYYGFHRFFFKETELRFHRTYFLLRLWQKMNTFFLH